MKAQHEAWAFYRAYQVKKVLTPESKRSNKMTTFTALLEDKKVLYIEADYFLDEGGGSYSFWANPETVKDDPLLVAHVQNATAAGDGTKMKL